jgi:hypothetical protein
MKSFRSMHALRVSCLLSVALMGLGSGCAVDATHEESASDGPTGETAQALSGIQFITWGGTVNSTGSAFTNGASFSHDMGVGAGWVCWLAAVNGNLQQNGGVEVLQAGSGGEWSINVSGIQGSSVSGSAVCAPATSVGGGNIDQIEPAPVDGEAPFEEASVLTGVGANSWCGISGINDTSLPPYDMWNSTASVATVSNNGTNPSLSSTGSTWTLSETGGNVLSYCATVPSISGRWEYEAVAPASGSTGPLEMLNGTEQLPAGTVCFITSIRGKFLDNNFSDGVALAVNFSTNAWTIEASNGKTVFATCIL